MTMSEARGDGGPLFFAAERPPPSVTVIDEDIYVTITAVHPLFPGEVETVAIMLSTETAVHLSTALNVAVGIVAKDAEASPPH